MSGRRRGTRPSVRPALCTLYPVPCTLRTAVLWTISIVILDDNPGSLDLLSTALARDGLTIHTASRPSEALALVHQHHPQLVLTDLVMPEMTGLDVLNRIMEIAPITDVVLMTAHYTTETAVQAIRNGAADYLEKPIRLPVLRERVGRLIEEARRRRNPAPARNSRASSAPARAWPRCLPASAASRLITAPR